MGEIVVGISGASGAIYGKRLVEILRSKDVPVRLVVTNAGEITLKMMAILEPNPHQVLQTSTLSCSARVLAQRLENWVLESVIT